MSEGVPEVTPRDVIGGDQWQGREIMSSSRCLFVSLVPFAGLSCLQGPESALLTDTWDWDCVLNPANYNEHRVGSQGACRGVV